LYNTLLLQDTNDASMLFWRSSMPANGITSTAYRTALEEQTCEREPLDWASTHTNLGTALLTLGERVGGTEHLEDAIAAYDAALTVFVPAQAASYVSICRSNQAGALSLLLERVSQGGPGSPAHE
jgi:hypothetical protein